MKDTYRLNQSRRISLSVQRFHLASETDGRCISRAPHRLRWRYMTRPSALGREYEVLISYALSKSPQVFVLSPNLFELTDKHIPHLFHSVKDDEYQAAACLCLFMKKYGEWHSQKSIAATVIPWVDLWLLYFEYWLATGDWEGGGEHPK